MKNEKRFITECIKAFLGDPDPVKLRILFKAVDIGKLNDLMINQRMAGFLYFLYINGFFDEIDIGISGKNGIDKRFRHRFPCRRRIL